MPTFDRSAECPKGHRFYTSLNTMKTWGFGGQRAPGATEEYETQGWLVTRPPEGRAWDDYHPARLRRVLRQPVEPQGWLGAIKAPAKRGTVIPFPNDGPSADWLAHRNAAGHATRTDRPVTMVEGALVRSKSPLIITLRRVSELMRPITMTAANDNELDDDEDANPGVGFERKHDQSNMLPSIPEMLAAFADGMRPRVVTDKGGKMKRYPGGRTFQGGWQLIGTTDHGYRLSGLIFINGELIAYGDYNGRRRKPKYLDGVVTERKFDDDSVTADHVRRQDGENDTYIRLGSDRQPAANDNAPPMAIDGVPVRRFPAGIAAGYGRLAGVSEPKGAGKGRTRAPRSEVLNEMERTDRLAEMELDQCDLDIIEDVLADFSFTRIAQERGYAQSSAHRSGKRLVENALTRISEKIAA